MPLLFQSRILLLVVFLPIVGVLFLVSSTVAIVKTIPLVTPEQRQLYDSVVQEVLAETGIELDVRELIAIDAVRYQQDFSRVTQTSIKQLAWRFIRKETKKVGEETVTVYKKRDLDDVLNLLVKEKEIAESEIEDVYRYLQEHGEDGGFPPGDLPLPDPSAQGFVFPIQGDYRLTDVFRDRYNPVTGRAEFHKGIDLAASKNTPVVAAKGGTVVMAEWNGSAGQEIKVDHGQGIVTRYLHLATFNVRTGEQVETGQRIGGVGSTGQSTGNHLHFELHLNGKPVNPLPYLKGK